MRTDDTRRTADAIRRDFPDAENAVIPDWNAPPSARVIDCVLSLNRRYESVVAPRVDRFVQEHPDVRSLRQLREMIDGFDSPAQFLKRILDMADARRAATLSGVVDYLLEVQQRFEGATELERLQAWAAWARPGDYLAANVRGFGLAGFQYMRILFGAHTTKPDRHIIRYVSQAVGRDVSDIEACYILEQAAESMNVPISSLDFLIWKAGSGGASSQGSPGS